MQDPDMAAFFHPVEPNSLGDHTASVEGLRSSLVIPKTLLGEWCQWHCSHVLKSPAGAESQCFQPQESCDCDLGDLTNFLLCLVVGPVTQVLM